MVTAKLFTQHGGLGDLNDILDLAPNAVEKPEQLASDTLLASVEVLEPSAVQALLHSIEGAFYGVHARSHLELLGCHSIAEEVVKCFRPGFLEALRSNRAVLRQLRGVQERPWNECGQDGQYPSKDRGEVDDGRLGVPVEIHEAHSNLSSDISRVWIHESAHEQPVVGEAEHHHVLGRSTDQPQQCEADGIRPCHGGIEVRILRSERIQLVEEEHVDRCDECPTETLERQLHGCPGVCEDTEEAELHHVRPEALVGTRDEPAVDEPPFGGVVFEREVRQRIDFLEIWLVLCTFVQVEARGRKLADVMSENYVLQIRREQREAEDDHQRCRAHRQQQLPGKDLVLVGV
mmetsp:Transcript_26068/g.61041  ORF Transcript_26068/g.61041 Transcript_26068/m.61041 type:complete len:347 (+) Transcript_26068:1863-2903(+)